MGTAVRVLTLQCAGDCVCDCLMQFEFQTGRMLLLMMAATVLWQGSVNIL
jgi:hypothetical protein